jgi:hypothetical protein
MPADTPDATDSGVEVEAITLDGVSAGQDGPAELGDRFCSRPDCEFADVQHMHIAQLPHGWTLSSGDTLPVVLDPPA